MPLLQRPIFPAESKFIAQGYSVECQDQKVVYFSGMLPAFQHLQDDLQGFRMYTSQLIDMDAVRQVDIVNTFGVPLATVKRYLKLYREESRKAFFTEPKRRSSPVLTDEVRQKIERLLGEGRSVPEAAADSHVKVNTLHKAIRAGRLHARKRESTPDPTPLPTQSERSEIDSAALMGRGATRIEERVAASQGLLSSATIEFAAGQDIAGGGVLLAVPALLAQGLLAHQEMYTLPEGYYGVASIFLLLALMALARVPSLEKLRYEAPGEWGKLLGLDRIPEVRTLRAKLKLLCAVAGRAVEWNAALAKQWITADQAAEPVFYVDGHVRVYHGKATALPKHYVARERLYHRAQTDYWINAMDGQPFLCINQPVDHGMVSALREDVLPWLLKNLVVSAERQRQLDADPGLPLTTIVCDREGYSPELFEKMWEERIAVITYHRYPKEDWPVEEFREESVELGAGVREEWKLAERTTELGRKKVPVREVRRLAEGGRQISLVSTHPGVEGRRLAVLLWARWSQENYFRYMRQHFGLDALVEHGTEEMPDTTFTVNPAWRKLDVKVRQMQVQGQRVKALLGAGKLDKDLSEAAVQEFQLRQGQLIEQSEQVEKELEALKVQRQAVKQHVLVKDLPKEHAFRRLRPERKHLLDTVKMVSYRAETSMVAIVREKLARSDDGRALLQQIYQTPADLIPDLQAKTLTVRLHHLTQRTHDEAIRHLCEELNSTETLFPGTELALVYKLGSD